MKSVKDLIAKGIKNTPLNILVFGPQVTKISKEERIRNLQFKRIQIRTELETAGHNVKYAEDLVDPSLPDNHGNAFLQEIVIMAEYDLIFAIVDSPGSIVEATLIASKPALSQKSSLFLDDSYNNGLTAEACRFAQILGADFNTYSYPTDLTDCNLLTFILNRITRAQFVKLIS